MLQCLQKRKFIWQSAGQKRKEAGFGLVGLLKHYGVSAVLCYVGQIDRVNTKKMTELCRITIYPENELPEEMKEEDPVICVDSQKGGGHSFMAGGLIPRENLEGLGELRDQAIRERFLNWLKMKNV